MRLNANLNNTLLDINGTAVTVANPSNATATKSTDAHTKDTTKDRMGSGNRETETSGHGEVTSGGDNSANHTEHEKSRAVSESVDVDDLGSDGVCDSTTNTETASELHDTGTDHGLEVAQRAGGDGRRPRVGDIVGTNVPGVEEGKDCAYRE